VQGSGDAGEIGRTGEGATGDRRKEREARETGLRWVKVTCGEWGRRETSWVCEEEDA
jgi:hypothetical protein